MRNEKNDKQCCMRPGPLTNNGYLNFLREFRKNHCEFSSATELVKAGAKEWNSLTCEEKMGYKCVRFSKYIPYLK